MLGNILMFQDQMRKQQQYMTVSSALGLTAAPTTPQEQEQSSLDEPNAFNMLPKQRSHGLVV